MLSTADSSTGNVYSVMLSVYSGIVTGGQGGQSVLTSLTAKENAKYQEKEGENQEKVGKKGRNQEQKEKSGRFFFTLPLLTDRAGYATGGPLLIAMMCTPVMLSTADSNILYLCTLYRLCYLLLIVIHNV